MRWVVLLMLGGLLAGWGACQWESAPEGETPGPQRWIRTVDGWERVLDHSSQQSPYAPPLHPLVIASGQVLLVLLAFLLFPSQSISPENVAPQRAASPAPPAPAAPRGERRRANFDRRQGERRQARHPATPRG